MKNIFFKADGSISLVAQQESSGLSYFRSTSYYYYMNYVPGYTLYGPNPYINQPTGAVMEHQYNLILVMNLSSRGNLNWLKMIPKYQAYPYREYLSFVAGYDDDNVYLLYNENNENIKHPSVFTPKKMNNPHKAWAVITTIDNSGNSYTRPVYMAKKNFKMGFKPNMSFNLKSNSVLLFTEKDNLFRLGEIELR